MNLAWLAAVLQPHDIAPHPNFADAEYDTQGPPQLAAIIAGGPWRLRRDTRSFSESERGRDQDHPALTLVEGCLRPDTIAASVPELASRLVEPDPGDVAETAALTLVLCSAAAELDDYTTCFDVLDAQLRRSEHITEADGALVRSAVLQQKVLRLRDAGRPHSTDSLEAADLLTSLDVSRCSDFLVSRGVEWSSRTTLEQIRASLLDAVGSLAPTEGKESSASGRFPSWQERVRSPVTSAIVRTARERADNYSSYVARLFADQFSSRARTIGGRQRPDLFHATLLLELYGHGQVYAARKELALLRLVQADDDSTELADALRLLRHAAARNELALALRRMRYAGPLAVLSHDSRQILRTRLAPELLRTVELQVLTAAAELLAPPEARIGLDAVRECLAQGGPFDLPGQWQLPLLRSEKAWVAAAALGNACGAASEVAQLLLDEVAKQDADNQILDQSLHRGVAQIEWATVSASIREAWANFFERHAATLPASAQTVLVEIGRPPPAPTSAAPLEQLAGQLNAAVAGGRLDPAVVRDAVPLVRDGLTTIRMDARRGSYSMGGISEADLAAGLIVVAHADELWSDLADFLIDSAVHREHRSPAFERLARANVDLPPNIKERFRTHARELLGSESGDPLGTPLTPYPEALRFLGSYGIVSDEDTYDAIAALAGSTQLHARQQASRTVAAVAATRPRPALLALALSLARDDDIEVRAHAGRALAEMATLPDALAAPARRRLEDLLAEDGLLAPLLLLRAIGGASPNVTEAIRSRVEDLAQQHPSRAVRAEAVRVLR